MAGNAEIMKMEKWNLQKRSQMNFISSGEESVEHFESRWTNSVEWAERNQLKSVEHFVGLPGAKRFWAWVTVIRGCITVEAFKDRHMRLVS